MKKTAQFLLVGAGLVLAAAQMVSQVYSPKVLMPDEPDTTDLKSLAQTIYGNAHATTDREKAEAMWRYLLTNGRWVKPGMFYHIPGWAYEEPMGEVLDPIKLLNSYGFGLCYQDGPLLQALWEAGGFAHSRVWFLTGHTVAEVFYDGQYHYYDSDMMGYTTIGNGPVNSSTVASVQQLEKDPTILLSKLENPRKVKEGSVDFPWYNADVHEGAIGDLADLFTTTKDNHLYAYTRYPQGHTMDFALRPGERMVRYYHQTGSDLRYLPYKTDGKQWSEFPKDVGSILLVTAGPRSEKDDRRWSTGAIEYTPTTEAVLRATTSSGSVRSALYKMPSPYVVIAAQFSMQAQLEAGESLSLETSADDGHTWTKGSAVSGPHAGLWKGFPGSLAETAHGSLNAVAGTYGYWVRLTETSTRPKNIHGSPFSGLTLTTLFEFNPRSLLVLKTGENQVSYQATRASRHEIPVHANNASEFATSVRNVTFVSESGQGYLKNNVGQTGEMIFKLGSLDNNGPLSGFDVGGRFLDLQDGLAPDKLTAEVRKVAPWPEDSTAPKSASIEWSASPAGPWKELWTYQPSVDWPDHEKVAQVLRWPEVDRKVRELPEKTEEAYVRYRFQNLALDDVRLATLATVAAKPSNLVITHVWSQEGKQASATEEMNGALAKEYRVTIPGSAPVDNLALIFSVPTK